MSDFLQRLKTHKLVQWAIAYVAFAFALIQVLGAVSERCRTASRLRLSAR